MIKIRLISGREEHYKVKEIVAEDGIVVVHLSWGTTIIIEEKQIMNAKPFGEKVIISLGMAKAEIPIEEWERIRKAYLRRLGL